MEDRLHGAGTQPAPEDGRGAPYVECSDLFKIFKLADLEVVALRGVDLEILPGELMAVVGASGSGKTTLLNILAGLERPSAGRVRVGQRDLLHISDRELVLYRRREVGFVWQSTSRNLAPYLNVRDNVELPLALSGVGRAARRQRSDELLAALHIEGLARRFPGELSGGEQQRAAIGVALANRPPLLLADEPTGELDNQMAGEIFDLLGQMNRAFGVTVVVVTHFPGVAHHVNRVVHIRDGRISSESLMHSTFRRSGDTVEQEYLVVDRAGRLQLPLEYVEQLQRSGLSGLAAAELAGGQVTLKPAGQGPAARADADAAASADRPPQPPEAAPTVDAQATQPQPDPAPAPEPETVPASEPDPHALFRRPRPAEDKGE